MNKEQPNSIRVQPGPIQAFISELAQKSGMRDENADFLAQHLVKNDLRGVFSHGSVQMATYARNIRDGLINPNPKVRLEKENPSTLVVEGDGGLGYFASYRAAEELAIRCRETGIAVAVTKNHGHIGAAGIYSRMLAEQGFISYVTSGHQLSLSPEDSIMAAAGGSPMSFAVPTGSGVPMLLDFGAVHDLNIDSPTAETIFELAPGLVFRSMGLGFMCQALGGFLAGVPVEEKDADRQYPGAGQGSLIIALDPGRFIDADRFSHEMDKYMRITSDMRPMPGYDRATLPGILEAEREKEWLEAGIPVSPEHKEALAEAAREFGLELPF